MKILMFLIISIAFLSCSPWPSNDDYVNTFSKNETIKELSACRSVTKEDSITSGSAYFEFIVNPNLDVAFRDSLVTAFASNFIDTFKAKYPNISLNFYEESIDRNEKRMNAAPTKYCGGVDEYLLYNISWILGNKDFSISKFKNGVFLNPDSSFRMQDIK
jgi:hypothetical protein